MRESCKYGSVRGALSNERPYRDAGHFRLALRDFRGVRQLGSDRRWSGYAAAQATGR